MCGLGPQCIESLVKLVHLYDLNLSNNRAISSYFAPPPQKDSLYDLSSSELLDLAPLTVMPSLRRIRLPDARRVITPLVLQACIQRKLENASRTTKESKRKQSSGRDYNSDIITMGAWTPGMGGWGNP
jgi:hypothetical protein